MRGTRRSSATTAEPLMQPPITPNDKGRASPSPPSLPASSYKTSFFPPEEVFEVGRGVVSDRREGVAVSRSGCGHHLWSLS